MSFTRLAIAALAVALCATPLHARPLAAIKASGTLRVGLTGDYAPYSLRGADGAITGADVIMAGPLARAPGAQLVSVLRDGPPPVV